MPTELRIYSMHPGKLDEFVEFFKGNIVPTSAMYDVTVQAAWRHDEKNEFVWIRSYRDEKTLKRYSDSPERAVYSPKTHDYIESIDVRMIESVLESPPVAIT